jgi:hypothetical protein
MKSFIQCIYSINSLQVIGKISRLRKEYPPFEIFQNEVRSLYPEGRPISDWYREEQKKHKNWPPVPERTYKGKGWIGLSELVGKENRFKKK